jgi:hypothetical protein
MTFADWVLVLTLIFAWYHVGIIWLVQVVAWPLFGFVGRNEFEAYHAAWWRGIRYVIFVPSVLTLLGIILLLRFPPTGVPTGILWAGLALYIAIYGLTAVWWGPQQARLTDTSSPRFGLILRTHWLRTALVSSYALALLVALIMRMRA